MPTHAHKREVPYPPGDMFALVADIERYPEFLPWCAGARIGRREPLPDGLSEIVTADLIVAYKMFREQFTSRVTLDRPALRIDVMYLQGPFRRLVNHWSFEPHGADGCLIDFYIDFEFKSRTLQKLMESVFDRAVARLVAGFIDRADEIYAASPTPPLGAEPGPPRPA